jgi:hypothetical protein
MYIHEYPTCWEQKALFYITTPLQAVASVVYLILTPIYMVLGILTLPLMALTFAMSIVWLPILGAILLFAKISRKFPPLRPASFILALPFLVVGHFYVSLEPIMVPGDQEGKLTKLKLIEQFPYSSITNNPA